MPIGNGTYLYKLKGLKGANGKLLTNAAGKVVAVMGTFLVKIRPPAH
jgi:hypothetical protein